MIEEEDCGSLSKDRLVMKSSKKSTSLLRIVVLSLTMICSLYISSVCFRQSKVFVKMLHNQQLNDRVIPNSKFPDEFHYPTPTNYSREECRQTPVRFFAIVSMQRSGSGWFETLLNSHPNISSNGEIFSVRERMGNLSTILRALDRVYNLDWYSSAAKNDCTAAVGFKWMLNQGLMDHHEDIIEYFEDKKISVIFLFRRNLLCRWVSLLANAHDRSAKQLNGTHKAHVHSKQEADLLAKYKPTINVTMLTEDLERAEGSIVKALEYFKSIRHIVFYYEDLIKNSSKLNEVQNFLGVPRRTLNSHHVKIHTKPLSNQIENWSAVCNALNGTKFERFLHGEL